MIEVMLCAGAWHGVGCSSGEWLFEKGGDGVVRRREVGLFLGGQWERVVCAGRVLQMPAPGH